MRPDYEAINLFCPEAPNRTIWTHEMLYRLTQFHGEAGIKALEKCFSYTSDVVFDGKDFARAEGVEGLQRGWVQGGNPMHTLGLEEGLLAIFQQTIENAIMAHQSGPFIAKGPD